MIPCSGYFRVERGYEIEKSIFNLIIGKSEGIDIEFRIEILDGQIATLVKLTESDYWNLHRYSENMERRCFDPVKQSTQVVFGFLQHLDEESRCAGLEPVIVEHF